MAQKKSKYSEDRVKLRLTENDDKDFQKFLKVSFDKYSEPRIKFMEPDERGEDTITVVCDEFEIGEIIPEDENLYYNNIANARRAYLEIFEPEDGSGIYEYQAVIVVKEIITDEDLKKAKKSKILIYSMIILMLLVIGIMNFIKGVIIDGIFFTALAPIVFYFAFVKSKGNSSDFLPRSKRKQK